MEFLKVVKEKIFKLGGKDNNSIKQNERNLLKSNTLEWLKTLFPNEVTVIGREEKGIVIELPNNELGGITMVVDCVIKNLDYDGFGVCEHYEKKQEEKRIEKEKKAEEKKRKIAKAKSEN